MLEKMEASFESKDGAKLFLESLEEFLLNKRIDHIYKDPRHFLGGGVEKEKFICEIFKVEDGLVKNIEALMERFNGKHFY